MKQLSTPIYTKPTAKRYLILCLFVTLTIIKGFQWICFATITNVIVEFYNVDNIAVNWTTVIFMVTFMTLALPVNLLMEQIGIRKSILIGAIGTTAGLLVKCFSIQRDRFYLAFIGHLLIGFSEPFYFSTYSQLALTWFPDNEVGRATAIGLTGDSLGVALGFIIPSLLVGSDLDDIDRIDWGLTRMFYGSMIASAVTTFLIILFFDDQPKHPPGVARFKQIEAQRLKKCISSEPFRYKLEAFSGQVVNLLSNSSFNMVLLAFGICEGAGYAIHTVLNQMIAGDPTLQYPDPVIVVGNVGLILLIAGILGQLACGALLDRYHSYKSVSIAMYLLSLISLLSFSLCLHLNDLLVLYLLTIPLGFFLAGFRCCGFEFAVEVTYPESELMASTMLNFIAQVFGIAITFGGSSVVDRFGASAGCWLICSALILGLVVTCLARPDYRRFRAANSELDNCAQREMSLNAQVAKSC